MAVVRQKLLYKSGCINRVHITKQAISHTCVTCLLSPCPGKTEEGKNQYQTALFKMHSSQQ